MYMQFPITNLMQFSIELWYIVIPLSQVEISSHRDTQVVLCHYVFGLGVIATFFCQAHFRLGGSDPSRWLLVDCVCRE